MTISRASTGAAKGVSTFTTLHETDMASGTKRYRVDVTFAPA